MDRGPGVVRKMEVLIVAQVAEKHAIMRSIRRGDVFQHVLGGAGGWGDPAERDPVGVAHDVAEGKLTAEHMPRVRGLRRSGNRRAADINAISQAADGPGLSLALPEG